MKAEAVAKHRAAVLRPILELEKRGSPIGRAIGAAAWELGLSKSYTWKLYRRLKENDARSVALQPGRRGPKPGNGRLVPDVERIISTNLRRYYLVRERPSFLRVVREIRAECDAKGFQPPTRRTVKRRLDAMDQRKVVSKGSVALTHRKSQAPLVCDDGGADGLFDVFEEDIVASGVAELSHLQQQVSRSP